MARPTSYSSEIADKICDEIATSTLSLGAICAESDEFPESRTVWRWLAKYPEFGQKYARARELQADLLAEEAIDISDDNRQDTEKRTTRSGEQYDAPNHEWISRSKLRVETRLKLMEKLAPKKYGVKTTNELTGPNGQPLGQALTPAQIAAALNALAQAAPPSEVPDDGSDLV